MLYWKNIGIEKDLQFDRYLENKESQNKAVYVLAETYTRVPSKMPGLFFHFQEYMI